MPIKTISLTSIEDFISVLRPSSSHWNGNIRDWIFRGQRDANWHLVPTAFRPDTAMSFKYHNIRGIAIHKREQFENELNLLLDFVEMADSLALNIPGDSYLIRTSRGMDDIQISFRNDSWPSWELHEIIAIAQHHGVPTRFLDFSRNGFKAAFFAAAEGYKHFNNNPTSADNICVWAINRKMLLLGIPTALQRIGVVTVPRVDNEYLHAQEGLFLYDCWANREFGTTAFSVNLEDIVLKLQEFRKRQLNPYTQDIIYKITLPIESSKLLLRELDSENINEAFLMPTFDKVVSTLRFNRDVFNT